MKCSSDGALDTGGASPRVVPSRPCYKRRKFTGEDGWPCHLPCALDKNHNGPHRCLRHGNAEGSGMPCAVFLGGVGDPEGGGPGSSSGGRVPGRRVEWPVCPRGQDAQCSCSCTGFLL